MRVSLNTVAQYTHITAVKEELIDKINRQLGSVEQVINLAERFTAPTIVRVVSAQKHPDADRLQVCLIDDGGVTEGVERTEEGYVQVVCGAPNARNDILAVWLPPNSVVPASYDEDELFTLSSRKLRGVMSHGMLAAADELGIGSDHAGIVEISDDDVLAHDTVVKPGDNFAQVFGLDDTLIDIENKMFTHRPDLFGQIGVAREFAGITGQQFSSPEWYTYPAPQIIEATKNTATYPRNKATDVVYGLMTAEIKGVYVAKSPLWLQCALYRLGAKSINNIVDITNLVMLLTAQPVHAYDRAAVQGGALIARRAKSDGESIELLNGKTIKLHNDDIVIADAQSPISLAGVMGGKQSEVSASTTDIVLEVATFDMYTIRKTSMRHGLFTDAVTRFNKGQSPLQAGAVMNLLVALIERYVGGSLSYIENANSEPVDSKAANIITTASYINQRLGLSLKNNEIQRLLGLTEISVNITDDSLIVTPPFWRTDLELAEDVVEEVGRLVGFDTLPQQLPLRHIAAPRQLPMIGLVQTLRSELAHAGANETLNYSFVHEKTIKNAGQSINDAYKISNALSPELQYYRLSLLPSLLEKVYPNIKAGHDSFVLFEIGKTHRISNGNEKGLPREPRMLELVYAAKEATSAGAAYYMARAYADQIAVVTGRTFDYQAIDSASSTIAEAIIAPYEPSRSAVIIDKASGRDVGIVGELRQNVRNSFKLHGFTAGVSILADTLVELYNPNEVQYAPLSRYPSTLRDVCFAAPDTVAYGTITLALETSLEDQTKDGELNITYKPIDVYQAADSSVRNTTYRLEISSPLATLTADQIQTIVSHIASDVKRDCAAELV